MADPTVRISGAVAEDSGDVEMHGGDSGDVMEVGETGAAADDGDAPGEEEEAEDETAVTPAAPRATFVE